MSSLKHLTHIPRQILRVVRVRRRTRHTRLRQARRTPASSHRSDCFAKILSGSIYSTNLYQTMTTINRQGLIRSKCVVFFIEPEYCCKILDAMSSVSVPGNSDEGSILGGVLALSQLRLVPPTRRDRVETGLRSRSFSLQRDERTT